MITAAKKSQNPAAIHGMPNFNIEMNRYRARITDGAHITDIDVFAFTAVDAITAAVDQLYDGDDAMPVDGLFVSVEQL